MTRDQNVGDAADIREIVARAESTLAAPSARIELRTDIDTVRTESSAPRRPPGLAEKMVRRVARAGWERIAPVVHFDELRDAFLHRLAEGIIEPAADRYQLDFGRYARMRIGGERYHGGPGEPPRRLGHQEPGPGELPDDDPLEMLGLLRQVTEASHTGDEAVRGTRCRRLDVRVGPAALTVWIDDEHVRRVRSGWAHANTTASRSFELWDFGPPDTSLDWSRLPAIRRGESR